ncbi:MAG: PAS domain-containing sensor histidine kinase [Halolamina sp.]|uniref:PAS domain-containing sensor histidine kinase n=1 Tax=Halolamina sp. TaxID=1940283 RepID=UPI002FC35BD2
MADRPVDPALYREAFAAATGANLITDDAFRIVDANDACLETLDWGDEALLNTTPAQLFVDPAVFEAATDRLTAGKNWREEFELRTGDGRRLQVAGTATPIYVDGERRGAVFGFVDLTNRHNRQESLRVLNRVLRHNLRNDANVVLGHLETAAELAANERVVESIEVAKERTKGSLDRGQTARAFSRHLVTDDEATLYPVDLAGALKQAINTVDTEAATLQVDVPSGLHIRADETVTSAVRNIVENAVEHTGPTPTIAIDTVADEETITLRVGDDGRGIPPERRDRVLERGGSAVRHGQGLGLFFVDRLLDVYGGELTIDESDLGGCLILLEFRRASDDGVEFELG